MADTCGASKRNGDGKPCELPAGWGTDHPGEGRCKHHGGSAGAPKGNSNAVTTGEHEAIFYDQLEEDEQELWHDIDAGHLAQVNEQLRLINVRERRMLRRIRAIKRDELTLVEWETEEGHVGEGPLDVERKAFSATIERIQNIEQALTRVQAEHRKLIREKYRILKDQPADQSEKLDELLTRMDKMRGEGDDYSPPEMG